MEEDGQKSSPLMDRFLCGETNALPKLHHTLYVMCREEAGREASPTACVIDSQSVKSAEKEGGCTDRNGYDAGEKIKGKKRVDRLRGRSSSIR